MKKSVSDLVVSTIKDDKVKPTSVSVVRLRFVLIGAGIVLLVGLASVLVALVVDACLSTDFHGAKRAAGGSFKALGFAVPWLIALLSVVGITLVAMALRNTPQGYKWSKFFIVLPAVLIPASVGTVLVVTGASHKMEHDTRTALPPYKAMQEWREDKLYAPEQGVLVGMPFDIVPGDRRFLLKDREGNEWVVVVRYQHEAKQVHFPKRFSPEKPVIVVGEEAGDQPIVESILYGLPDEYFELVDSGEYNLFIAERVKPVRGGYMRP